MNRELTPKDIIYEFDIEDMNARESYRFICHNILM